jgi:hypothetical protein
VINLNDFIGKLSFLILNNCKNLAVDFFVEAHALLGTEVFFLDPLSH